MSKYVELVADGVNTSKVASGGIDKKGLTGSYRGLIWTEEDFSFTSNTTAKDIDTHNTAVAAGNLVPLGKGKFADNSTDATFFEDAPLNIRIKSTDKTYVTQFDIAVNACTTAELLKMEGKTGRVFLISTKGILIGRKNDDGTVQGMELSSVDVDYIDPTDDTPVAYVRITMTFADKVSDLQNPFQATIDWDVEDIDQVFAVAPEVGVVSSSGTELTAVVKLTDALAGTKLTGAALADFKAEDDDGNTLTITTVTASASPDENEYTIVMTTALTSAYISFDGIRTISSTLFYLDSVNVKTA